MRRVSALVFLLAAAVAWFGALQGARAAERRVALVVGEAAYPAKPLATPANDAGLVAQTLQAAGFDVTGARDLEEEALKRAFRDFLDKVGAAGPDTVAFVYFAGYGLQLEGENYLIPTDVVIRRDADIPMRALRVSDYLKPLAASGAKLSIVVLDAARANPFQLSGAQLAGGLALYEPGANMLLAFNAAPGTVAPEEKGPYGAYAHALAEMIRDGGRPLGDVLDQLRLRVADATKGAQIPWNSAKIDTPFLFFERSAQAPASAPVDPAMAAKPIAEMGPRDGYAAALRRDDMAGYQAYLAAYPSAPSAKRVRAILAARREALTWRRTRVADTPNAYWSYLRRYPRGPHAWDARRRLAQFAAAMEPPADFEMIDYVDVPPPPGDEFVYVDRPVLVFDDPIYGFAPPPPPPVYFLPPPPPDFVVLPPPLVIAQPYVLPAPVYVPVPVWQRAPAYVAPPPNNLIFDNVHNSIVVDRESDRLLIRDPGGRPVSSGAITAAGAVAGAAAIGAALPAFMGRKAPGPAPTPVGVPNPAGTPTSLPGAAPAGIGAPPQAPLGLAPQTGPAPSGGRPSPSPLPPRAEKPPTAPLDASKTVAPPLAPAAVPKDHGLPSFSPSPSPSPLGASPVGGKGKLAPQAPESAPPAPGAVSPKETSPRDLIPKATAPADHALPKPSLAPGGTLKPKGLAPKEPGPAGQAFPAPMQPPAPDRGAGLPSPTERAAPHPTRAPRGENSPEPFRAPSRMRETAPQPMHMPPAPQTDHAPPAYRAAPQPMHMPQAPQMDRAPPAYRGAPMNSPMPEPGAPPRGGPARCQIVNGMPVCR